MLKLIEDLMNEDGMIELNGELLTVEEALEKVKFNSDFDIIESSEPSWFERALMDEEQ